jgi:integrase/recombinase XerD
MCRMPGETLLGGISMPLSLVAQETIATFIGELRSQEDLKPATLRNYESDLRHFASWFEEVYASGDDQLRFRLDTVVTPTITAYRTWCHQQGHRPATINRRLVVIKRLFGGALDSAAVAVDPAAPVRLVEQEKAPPRHLTDQEEGAFMATVGRDGRQRDRVLFTVLLHTGLRTQEVCDLLVADVEIEKRAGWLTVRSGKRGKWREVPLNETVREALKEYIAGLTGPRVFPGRKGDRLTERSIRLLTTKFANRAGVNDLSPHDFRHRFGYRMAAAGTPLHVLAQLMGHDNPKTTMIYIQATRGDLQAAVEKIAWS